MTISGVKMSYYDFKENSMESFSFSVIDKKTGKEADDYMIALKEDWAKDLMYCDMDGFAITQDGYLILLDECGQFRYCPLDRFEVKEITLGVVT